MHWLGTRQGWSGSQRGAPSFGMVVGHVQALLLAPLCAAVARAWSHWIATELRRSNPISEFASLQDRSQDRRVKNLSRRVCPSFTRHKAGHCASTLGPWCKFLSSSTLTGARTARFEPRSASTTPTKRAASPARARRTARVSIAARAILPPSCISIAAAVYDAVRSRRVRLLRCSTRRRILWIAQLGVLATTSFAWHRARSCTTTHLR